MLRVNYTIIENLMYAILLEGLLGIYASVIHYMKKRYVLNGFPNREEAQKRNHEFAIKHGIKPNSATKFMFSAHCLQKEEWGLEVFEENLELLDDIEKTPQRLREIPYQPFIQSFVPMVYRYLESEWVDEFFETGNLRLSSFKKFHQHTDEQRGDKNEGRNMVVGYGEEKQMTSMVSSGLDAFVLSTSLMYSEQMYNDFLVDSCFVIEKPLEFMDAIIKQIPEFRGVNFGPCLYKPDNIIERNIPGFDIETLRSDDAPESLDMGKMFNTVNQAGGSEVLFTKTNQYAPQHEYRMLWHTFLDPMPEYIDINAPEALKFCRKINK
jgi:hypothetical protein